MKHYDEMETAVVYTARLEDFDGDVQKWKIAFYEIWRYQMTYHFARRIIAEDSRNHGAFVRLTVKPAFKHDALGMMEDLGYKNITTEDAKIGLVYAYEHDDLEDIDLLVLDY